MREDREGLSRGSLKVAYNSALEDTEGNGRGQDKALTALLDAKGLHALAEVHVTSIVDGNRPLVAVGSVGDDEREERDGEVVLKSMTAVGEVAKHARVVDASVRSDALVHVARAATTPVNRRDESIGRRVARAQQRAPNDIVTCLLYTSDAADE